MECPGATGWAGPTLETFLGRGIFCAPAVARGGCRRAWFVLAGPGSAPAGPQPGFLSLRSPICTCLTGSWGQETRRDV